MLFSHLARAPRAHAADLTFGIPLESFFDVVWGCKFRFSFNTMFLCISNPFDQMLKAFVYILVHPQWAWA